MAATGCSTLENLNKCRSADPDTRIAGCSAVIQSSLGKKENLYLVYNNRGTAYSRKGNHALAIQDFSEAIRLNPNYANLYRNRGVDYYAERDYDHAIQDFNDATRLIPTDADSFYYRGNAYGGRGVAYDSKSDYAHAIQDYNEAIRDYTEA